ncbi:hypothetical protein I5E97_03965 [Proteus hauseri]|uniref:hypothetical protein n=1 Tax=Proteus cibi TaxID=2050966 RepID=UPI000D68D96B|nr:MULTISPECIES: hypothetical protein [Proteus]MBG6030206.1 hypothetical protein [Proteus hauseri]MBS6208908.1 hypothetical protein [Proteus hauseri]
MDYNIKNNSISSNIIKEAFIKTLDEPSDVKRNNNEINDNESGIKNLSNLKKINDIIEKNIKQINSSIPNLKLPEDKNINVKNLMRELNKDSLLKNDGVINSSGFNFISKEMMGMINLIINYLKSMIKKYESSRELGNTLMKMQIDIANKIKDALNQKADFILGAAISSATLSMTINGIGAFTSIKGINKGISVGNPRNETTIKGDFISATAEPISKIVDNSIQNNALRIEGNNKVLEASSQSIDKINNNNSEIQRENLDFIKTFIKALETIIQANQDVNAHLSNKV